MSSSSWQQIFYGHASIYALDEITKQWADRGLSGKISMFKDNKNVNDVRIKWEKNNNYLWWRLTSSKLKAKGERALVLKAWSTLNNQQEILAIRFQTQQSALHYASKYVNIFPMSLPSPNSIHTLFTKNGMYSDDII